MYLYVYVYMYMYKCMYIMCTHMCYVYCVCMLCVSAHVCVGAYECMHVYVHIRIICMHIMCIYVCTLCACICRQLYFYEDTLLFVTKSITRIRKDAVRSGAFWYLKV